MHEMSLVEALLTQIAAHVPAGSVVRRVHLRAGPLHGIEPEAMQWAWAIAVEVAGWPGAVLELENLPWRLRCLSCDHTFTAARLDTPCPCGETLTNPVGGDELTLLTITYDDPATDPATDPIPEPSHAADLGD